jgi:hypothetical protein
MKNRTTTLPLALLLASALAVVPVEAQGNGRGNGNGNAPQRELREDRRDREQPRLERRDDDRRRDDRQDARRRQDRRSVPPGWCLGRGNPHNTPANCGYRDDRGRNVRYDTRYERRGGSFGSYEDAHRQFHRDHDAWCRARRAERPLDLRWQAQVRLECREAHDRFHREWGRTH